MKGDEDKIFDDFLKNSLGNYQVTPPPALWKGIVQKIPVKRIGRFPFGLGNPGLIGFISGGIILTSVIVYNWQSRNNKTSLPADTTGFLAAQNVPSGQKDMSKLNTLAYTGPTQTSSPGIQKLSGKPNAILSKQRNSKPAMLASLATPVSHSAVYKPNGPGIPGDLTKTEYLSAPQINPAAITDNAEPVNLDNTPVLLADNTITAADELFRIFADKSYYFELSKKTANPDGIMNDPSHENPATLKILPFKGDYARKSAEISIGAWYQPEWLNKPESSRYKKTRQTFGLTATLKKSPFSIETGLGIMKEEAWQDYDITYRQMLGTYNDLHFVSFDSLGNPSFYYNTDSVFDPGNKSQSHTKLARYTYLQIPMILGLERTLGRSSLTLKAGPVFSLLLSKKEDKPVMDADQHIITVSGDHPDRLQTTWLWYLGLGYSYAVTDRISVFFEPSVRGYMNTPYERKRKQKDNPVYIGIRSGIIFQLKNPFVK